MLYITEYYRVNYDVNNWLKIANYLKSSMTYWKIHVLNRAQLIDDAFHLMLLQKLNSNLFWNLVEYLSNETDYIPWYSMFKAAEHMSSVFPLSGPEIQDIKVNNNNNNLSIKNTYSIIVMYKILGFC